MNQLQSCAREWFIARNIIANLLVESGYTSLTADEKAAAILARLAENNPPILFHFHYAKELPCQI